MPSALTNASEPEFVSMVNESLANDVSMSGPLENDSSYEQQDKSPKTCRYFVKGSCQHGVKNVNPLTPRFAKSTFNMATGNH